MPTGPSGPTAPGWRKRRFAVALEAAGVDHVARPYDLRHAFASLLLAEGRSVHAVAPQLGHAPSMTLDTYRHVIDELEGQGRIDAEAEIRAAREALVPRSTREFLPKPSIGLEPMTPSLPWKCSTN
jgi:integrase